MASKGKVGGSKGNTMKEPEFNWADRGKVTKVFDQGDFYMCWVVTALALCESKYSIQKKTAAPINLSKQEMLNCYFEKYPPPPGDKEAQPRLYDKLGFRTGSIKKALMYIQEHGVSMEEDWPWVGEKGPCSTKPNPKKVLWVRGIEKSPKAHPWKEKDVIEVLKKHPIAAVLVITPALMKLKKGEIYKGDKNIKDGDMRHAVLVVGCGMDPITKEKYYVIRNSWGEGWADKGYARVKRYLLSEFCYPEEVTFDAQK